MKLCDWDKCQFQSLEESAQVLLKKHVSPKAAGIRALLIVEEDIHDDFFRKTTGVFHHHLFRNLENFKYEIVDEVVIQLGIRYQEMLKKLSNFDSDIY